MSMNFYRGYENLIEFSSATVENPFGAQLLAMCEDVFEDLPSAVAGLTEALAESGFDVDEEGVVGLMTGEILPSEDVVDALTGLSEDEVDHARLYNAAAAMYDMLIDEDGEEDDDDVEAYYEDDIYAEDEYEDDVEVDYEDDIYDEDEYEDEDEYYEDEEPLAEVLYSRQIITDALDEYVEIGNAMVDQGYLSPHVHELLFGQSDKGRFVNFSAACEEFDATPAEYLKCIEFALNIFSEIGPMVNESYFSAQVPTDFAQDNQRIYEFGLDEDTVELQSREMVDLLGL